MSAGGMQFRVSLGGDKTRVCLRREPRKGAQMCLCLQSFRPSPELSLAFQPSLGFSAFRPTLTNGLGRHFFSCTQML